MNRNYDRDSGIYRGVRSPDPSEILSMISHDMRAPLMAILGAVDLLECGDTGLLNAYQRHLIGLIRRSGERMRWLASELSELGAAGGGSLELVLREEDLSQVLLLVLEEVHVTADARRRRIELSPLPVLRAQIDAQRIGRAFSNVLNNAIRHAQSTVSVQLEREPSGDACIVVEDDGEGLSDELLPVVFEPFVRASGGGMGLGLAIVREIVRAHGGRVAADNRPEGGARFELRLPAL